MSTENVPKFELRKPKAGEWYLSDDGMTAPTPTCATEALDTEHWVILIPRPEPAPWPGPEHEIIVITRISNSKNPQRILALRAPNGRYRAENGYIWYKDGHESDVPYITSWEPYQPSPKRREYTADDLFHLPEGAVVWDSSGDVWQKRDAIHWRSTAFDGARLNPLWCNVILHAYSAPPEENS